MVAETHLVVKGESPFERHTTPAERVDGAFTVDVHLLIAGIQEDGDFDMHRARMSEDRPADLLVVQASDEGARVDQRIVPAPDTAAHLLEQPRHAPPARDLLDNHDLRVGASTNDLRLRAGLEVARAEFQGQQV